MYQVLRWFFTYQWITDRASLHSTYLQLNYEQPSPRLLSLALGHLIFFKGLHLWEDSAIGKGGKPRIGPTICNGDKNSVGEPTE